jgi:hypothetical protein
VRIVGPGMMNSTAEAATKASQASRETVLASHGVTREMTMLQTKHANDTHVLQNGMLNQ